MKTLNNKKPPSHPVPLPSNVYEVSPGVYRMAINQGHWLPNDDNTYQNYQINDPASPTLVSGRGQIASNSLELNCFVNIPNGWKATKIFIDNRLSDGTLSDADKPILIYNVQTWTTDVTCTGAADLAVDESPVTNTEYTLVTPMVGQIDNAMRISVGTSDSSQAIAGGYITLEKV